MPQVWQGQTGREFHLSSPTSWTMLVNASSAFSGIPAALLFRRSREHVVPGDGGVHDCPLDALPVAMHVALSFHS